MTLVCWSCGKKLDIEVPAPPMFAFEFSDLVTKAGWHGVLDMAHSRALAFCSKACCEAQQTKKGTLRMRPKVVKVEACT